MKVTIIPKKEKQEEIAYNKIPTGTVYISTQYNGIMLKLTGSDAAVLTWSSGEDRFVIAHDSKYKPAIKILGKLKEIIVEKE